MGLLCLAGRCRLRRRLLERRQRRQIALAPAACGAATMERLSAAEAVQIAQSRRQCSADHRPRRRARRRRRRRRRVGRPLLQGCAGLPAPSRPRAPVSRCLAAAEAAEAEVAAAEVAAAAGRRRLHHRRRRRRECRACARRRRLIGSGRARKEKAVKGRGRWWIDLDSERPSGCRLPPLLTNEPREKGFSSSSSSPSIASLLGYARRLREVRHSPLRCVFPPPFFSETACPSLLLLQSAVQPVQASSATALSAASTPYGAALWPSVFGSSVWPRLALA